MICKFGEMCFYILAIGSIYQSGIKTNLKDSEVIAQKIGHVSCILLTQVQSIASTIVHRAASGVISEYKVRNNPQASPNMVQKAK